MITGKRRGETPVDPSLHVALALPGGDPIAAALAAGQTSLPEMVAASVEKKSFRPRTVFLCLALVFAGLPVFATYFDRMNIVAHAPLDIPPEALAFRAQEVLKQLGYADFQVDNFLPHGLLVNGDTM